MAFPPGHFYSPVIHADEIAQYASEIWPVSPECPGIDFNDEAHLDFLRDVLPAAMARYDYPEHGRDDENLSGFYTRNSQFSWLDSRVLFALLLHLRPRRLIEVGSGYSSLLIGDVNRRFLGGDLEFACIEPYPHPFLTKPACGVPNLVRSKVQSLPSSFADGLGPGDILFIDSSHVCKTGSDVNYLYFKIIPRLKPGAIVHVHDIFLPFDYPREWVLEGRNWNEQYLLRALLMHSQRYRVLFGCAYAHYRFPEAVAAALGVPVEKAFGGGSFWFQVR